jgi:hypothetical protein
MSFNYDPMTFPGPALPASCYRALHSYVLEAVLDMSDAQRQDIVNRCQGLPTWDRFMLAVFRGWLTVDTVPEAATGQPWLWVHYPRHDDGMAYPIVAVLGTDIGADPGALRLELAIRIQASLDAIVSEEPRP